MWRVLVTAVGLLHASAFADPDRVHANRFTPLNVGEGAFETLYVQTPEGWKVFPVYGSTGSRRYRLPPGVTFPECVAQELTNYAQMLQIFPFSRYRTTDFFELPDVANYL